MNATAICRRGAMILIAVFFVQIDTTLEAQRYSINAVGYADVTFYPGSNFVSNPFNAGDNSIPNLFKRLPHGSWFVRWNPALRYFDATNQFSTNAGWLDPNMSLSAPNGGMLWLPASTVVSFVGEPWPAMCVTYPQGLSFIGLMPRLSCALCLNGDCPAPVTHGTVMHKWNAQRQEAEPYTYLQEDFQPAGWYGQYAFFPGNPPFGIAEAAFFDVPFAFSAKLPSVGGTITQLMPVQVRATEHSRSNISLTLPVQSNAIYSVSCSTNLGSRQWHVVQQGLITPDVAAGKITVPRDTNGNAFFRVLAWPVSTSVNLINPVRTAGSFSCQFYAPESATFTLQRTTSLTNGAPWATVATVIAASNSIVTATDSSATGVQAYYRLSY